MLSLIWIWMSLNLSLIHFRLSVEPERPNCVARSCVVLNILCDTMRLLDGLVSRLIKLLVAFWATVWFFSIVCIFEALTVSFLSLRLAILTASFPVFLSIRRTVLCMSKKVTLLFSSFWTLCGTSCQGDGWLDQPLDNAPPGHGRGSSDTFFDLHFLVHFGMSLSHPWHDTSDTGH